MTVYRQKTTVHGKIIEKEPFGVCLRCVFSYLAAADVVLLLNTFHRLA